MCVINTIACLTSLHGVCYTHSAIKCVEHSNKSLLIVTTRAHQFQCVMHTFNFYSAEATHSVAGVSCNEDVSAKLPLP